MRYKTDVLLTLKYTRTAWKSKYDLKSLITITQQNLGNGDGTETTFRSLDPEIVFIPKSLSPENNIQLLLENVF